MLIFFINVKPQLFSVALTQHLWEGLKQWFSTQHSSDLLSWVSKETDRVGRAETAGTKFHEVHRFNHMSPPVKPYEVHWFNHMRSTGLTTWGPLYISFSAVSTESPTSVMLQQDNGGVDRGGGGVVGREGGDSLGGWCRDGSLRVWRGPAWILINTQGCLGLRERERERWTVQDLTKAIKADFSMLRMRWNTTQTQHLSSLP